MGPGDHYLPDSLLRPGRFDKLINVRLPNREESAQIIDYYLKSKAIDVDVDMAKGSLSKILDS